MAALALLALLAVVIVQPPAVFGVLERLTPGIVWRVATDEPLVALTFDDGPSPEHAPQVLDILARHGAHATFFLIGSRAMARPDLVRRITERGHEIAHHHWVNGSTLFLSDDRFAEAFDRTAAVLEPRGSAKLFRPPGGLIRPSHLALVRGRGYACVLGSAYPFDPSRPPAGYIRWLVTKNLRPGAIVILHDGTPDPSRTLAALDGILAGGREKGLTFVTVGRLLGKHGDPKEPPRPGQ